jgi:hypothetical protein
MYESNLYGSPQMVHINTPQGPRKYAVHTDPGTGETYMVPEGEAWLEGAPKEQRQQQSSPNTNMLQSMTGGTTATGMTPNAVNAYGEPYYGWGAQAGDWGATAGTGGLNAAPMGSGAGVAATEAGSEAAVGGMGSAAAGEGAGTAAGYGAGGLVAAALAAGTIANYFNNRSFDGQQSGTIFQGKGFNDPFLSLFARKIGFEGATPGEQLDADIANKDWKGLGTSVPEYLMHLGTPWNYAENELIDKMGFLPEPVQTGLKWFANPIHQLFRSIF